MVAARKSLRVRVIRPGFAAVFALGGCVLVILLLAGIAITYLGPER